jgi:hypothetical protein
MSRGPNHQVNIWELPAFFKHFVRIFWNDFLCSAGEMRAVLDGRAASMKAKSLVLSVFSLMEETV